MSRSKNITFGVRIPVEGWVPITTPHPDFSYFLRLAQAAEELKYDSILTADHLLSWIGSTPKKPASGEYLALGTYEAWTTLSALSTATKRVKLSNIVLCNMFRNPALLAKMAATLDVISGGRFVLSIGAGWLKEECRRLGIEWHPYKERIERLRESIQIMKTLWTQKVTDFNGTYYTLKDAVLEPKPVTKPHPPVWLGGASDSVIHIVAEEGDGWDVGLGGSPEEARAKIDSLIDYCDQISRKSDNITISHSCMVVLSKTREQSIELLKAKGEDLNATVDSLLQRHLAGPPSEIASRMNEYVDVGVRHFTLYFDRDLQNLEQFASEVIPRVG